MNRKEREFACSEWLGADPDVHRLDGKVLREIEALTELHPDRPKKGETAAAYAKRWEAHATARDEHRRRLESLTAERNALYVKLTEQFYAAVKQESTP